MPLTAAEQTLASTGRIYGPDGNRAQLRIAEGRLRFDDDAAFNSKLLQFVQSTINGPRVERQNAGNDAGQIERSNTRPFQQLRQFLREVIRNTYYLSLLVQDFGIGCNFESPVG